MPVKVPTPELIDKVTGLIIAGAFPHIAARTAGITHNEYEAWLTKGRSPKARKIYRIFAQEIDKAIATARAIAETAVFKQHPITWLKQGPGKERPDNPGWTTTVKPVVNSDNRTFNLLLDPQFTALFAAILQVLAPFPEARARVAEALAGQQIIEPRKGLPEPSKN